MNIPLKIFDLTKIKNSNIIYLGKRNSSKSIIISDELKNKSMYELEKLLEEYVIISNEYVIVNREDI